MPQQRRNKARKVWLHVHMSFGLVVGLLFVLTGRTGKLLVFSIEIDGWLNPGITFSSTKESWRSDEDMFQTLRTTHSTREPTWRGEIPSPQRRMMTVRYDTSKEKFDIFFTPLMT